MQMTKVYGFIRTHGFIWELLIRIKKPIIRSEKGNGVYAFILKGSAEIGGEIIEERDGFGVWDIQGNYDQNPSGRYRNPFNGRTDDTIKIKQK